jgi:hypothetical protein
MAKMRWLAWVVLLRALESSATVWEGASFCDDARYSLEWADEFDGPVLDETKWSPVKKVTPLNRVVISCTSLLLIMTG